MWVYLGHHENPGKGQNINEDNPKMYGRIFYNNSYSFLEDLEIMMGSP